MPGKIGYKFYFFSESFELKGNKVSGVAIHPKRIFHPDEGIAHVYLRPELKKAASTGAGKPFGIDHIYVLMEPNRLSKTWYGQDEDGICYEGNVDDNIAEQIRQKKFKGISVEINWLRPGGRVEYVEPGGVAAKNFELSAVHFLTRFPPGDPDAYVKLCEHVEEQLVVGPPQPLDQRVEVLEQQIQELLNQIRVINGKLEVLTGTSSPSATAQPTQLGASQTTGVMKMKEAEWDTEYVNNLPDSAFAYIEPGGEKDEQGKTKPRNLRHLPFKNAEGNIDHDHLVNALGRLPQTELSDEAKAEAKKKLCAAVNSWNSDHEDKIESEVCGTAAATGESLKATKALMIKLKEQGDTDECIRKGKEANMLPYEIALMCNVSEEEVLNFQEGMKRKKLKEQVPWLTADQQTCIENAIDAGKSGPEIAEECGIPVEAITGILMLKEQQGNQEPEKDVHGCLIGKERYDEENKKCVPIIAEAKIAFLEAKLRLKEQEGELTVEQIKAKIAELAKQREELDKKLWPEPPESGLSEEEKSAIRTQIDVLYAEIDAYEQALKAKIATQAVPPGTPPAETELKQVKETVVALRKAVVQAEAKLLNIEKKMKREAGSWKEKYETLCEAVKGAIPPPRIWKSWTSGPQRYVQENLKILRESASS